MDPKTVYGYALSSRRSSSDCWRSVGFFGRDLDRKLVTGLAPSLRRPNEGATTIPVGRLENPTHVRWQRAKERPYRSSMNSSRFDHDRRSRVTVQPSVQKYLKWIRVSRFGSSLLRDSAGSGRKKIFAIVAPSMPADLGCKTTRRILIFDNHPDSLRLVFGPRASHGQLPDPQRTPTWVVALLWILVVGLVMAMFVPFS